MLKRNIVSDEKNELIHQRIELMEKEIEKIEMNQPTNFEEKYAYHLNLFELYTEIACLYEIKEFIVFQIRKAFINFMFCLLISRDNNWDEKVKEILKKGNNFFLQIEKDEKIYQLIMEMLTSIEFEKQLGFLYSDPIDSKINPSENHSFNQFKNNCVFLIKNLNKDPSQIKECIDKMPFFFKIDFDF